MGYKACSVRERSRRRCTRHSRHHRLAEWISRLWLDLPLGRHCIAWGLYLGKTLGLKLVWKHVIRLLKVWHPILRNRLQSRLLGHELLLRLRLRGITPKPCPCWVCLDRLWGAKGVASLHLRCIIKLLLGSEAIVLGWKRLWLLLIKCSLLLVWSLLKLRWIRLNGLEKVD